jgi:radical SAM superfamily enzyme YgiQ (UPF0313 family)
LAAYAGKFADADGVSLRNHINIAEYTINQQTEDIEADIYKRMPDVLAVSCYIWNFAMVQELIEDIHQVRPDLPIWLGGPEVSFHPEKLMQKFPFLAGIMIGEGEQTFVELVQGYMDGTDISNIAGLYLPSGYTAERGCLALDDIPFLYSDLSDFENRIIYYESSRGCPFRCKYCLSSIDKQLRFRSLDLVKKELQFFLDNKVPQVKFIDRTFNAKHEHALAIWHYIKENDNGVTNFHFEISADLLTEEEITLLNSMRKGLVQLEIGVQSTNPGTIREINRSMDLCKLRNAVEKVNSAGNIHQHLDLIAGLPFEDYMSFHDSFNDVYAMRPEQLQLGFLKVLKGSAMEEQAEEYGIGYRKTPPYEVLYTKWLSYDDIIRLKRVEEMVELFYNSGQFVHTIRFLEVLFGDAFKMYETLGDYYEARGFLTASSKRISHYENILEFLNGYMLKMKTDMQTVEELTEICRQYLLFDCYLRENMKSAPSFAKENSAYKDYLRTFYQKEEEERTYLPMYEQYDSKQMAKMTHVEFFTYPVWEASVPKREELLARRLESPQPVLFDYKERDVITRDCRIVLLPTP